MNAYKSAQTNKLPKKITECKTNFSKKIPLVGLDEGEGGRAHGVAHGLIGADDLLKDEAKLHGECVTLLLQRHMASISCLHHPPPIIVIIGTMFRRSF